MNFFRFFGCLVITVTLTTALAAFQPVSYKELVANRIAELNPELIYPGHPQKLLKAVVVVRYVVETDGSIHELEVIRSRDDVASTIALAAVKIAEPLPPPIEPTIIIETFLFNDDYRFQVRTTAKEQP